MRASSALAFPAGGAIGAAAVYLTCTEKGNCPNIGKETEFRCNGK